MSRPATRDEWLSSLEAERYTRHWETRDELLARLELERPESPESVRRKHVMHERAAARVKARLVAERAAEVGAARSTTYLQLKLAELERRSHHTNERSRR